MEKKVDVKKQDALVELKDRLVIGRDAEKLDENKAWRKLVDILRADIQDVQEIKISRPSVDYIRTHKIKNDEGDEIFMTGPQLLEQQIRDEIKANAYLEILSAIQTFVEEGQKAEEILRKEMKTETK